MKTESAQMIRDAIIMAALIGGAAYCAVNGKGEEASAFGTAAFFYFIWVAT